MAFATVIAALAAAFAYAQPANAEDAPAAPTSTESTPTSTTPAPEAPPPAEPAPAGPPPTAPAAAPTGTTSTSETPASEPPAATEPAAPPATTDCTTAASKSSSCAAATDGVKLEPESSPPAATPAATPAVPAAPAPAAPATPAQAPSGAPPPVAIVLLSSPAPQAQQPAVDVPAEPAAEPYDNELFVGLITPHPGSRVAQLAPERLRAVKARALRPAGAKRLLGNPCAQQPHARVPLSVTCSRARGAVLGVTGAYLASPEVRAAIDRVVRRVAARRPDAEPRARTEAKTERRRPVVNARPTLPLQRGGLGAASDPAGGAAASSSSRLFALAPVPVRVPWPFRFARILLPSQIPHGALQAPPTARPG